MKDADEYLVDLRKRQEDLSQYVSGHLKPKKAERKLRSSTPFIEK